MSRDFLANQLKKRGRPVKEQQETPAHLSAERVLIHDEPKKSREQLLRDVTKAKGSRTVRVTLPMHDLIEKHRARYGYKSKHTALDDIILKTTQDYKFKQSSLNKMESIRKEKGFTTIGEVIDFLTESYGE